VTAESPPDRVEPPWWQPAKAPGRRRAPLSRDAIIDAAISILDRDGVDALTIRRLAKELDTGSATLYWHIRNKDELAEQVYDRVMGEIQLPEPDPSRWQEQTKDLARQSYQVRLRHNDLVRLSLGRIPVGPNMLQVMEWNLGLLRSAGIPDRPAAYFGDMLGRFVDASVLEVTMAPGAKGDLTDGDRTQFEAIAQYFAALPPHLFPNLLAVAGEMFVGDDDDRFEFGLDLLITGLAARIGG
jgi:AcrR family transcriptional regulator